MYQAISNVWKKITGSTSFAAAFVATFVISVFSTTPALAQVDLTGEATSALTAAKDDGLSVGAIVIGVVAALMTVAIIIKALMMAKKG